MWCFKYSNQAEQGQSQNHSAVKNLTDAKYSFMFKEHKYSIKGWIKKQISGLLQHFGEGGEAERSLSPNCFKGEV